MRTLLLAALFAAVSMPAMAECSAAPLGSPAVDGIETIEVCHKGYLSLLDPTARETRVVTYELTAAHSHGKGSRAGMTFKVDKLAAAEDQARTSDYANSGYDLGHMAPAEDFAWSADLERDTFSMANVEPQLPGLNRQGWERIEEIVRAEACRHGSIVVFTGPVFPGSVKIGKDYVVVPEGFFKIAVDPKTGWALAFMVQQENLAKGDAEKTSVAIKAIISATGLTFPLSSEIDRDGRTSIDDNVLADYRAGQCH